MEKYMKSYNSLLWGVAAVIVGLVLMIWPHNIIQWSVRLFGIVLVLVGAVQFLGFLARTRGLEDRWQYFPPSSVIAILGGAILLITPDFWAGVFAILCGVLLIFLGLVQIVSLIRVRKTGVKVSWGYYIFPLLLIMAGFVVVVQPLFMANWFVIFVGAWILAYGIMEIFAYFSLSPTEKKVEISTPPTPPKEEKPTDPEQPDSF